MHSATGAHLLITGGSRGIGASTVRLAVARGHRVTFTYRADEAAAIALVGELGTAATAVRADVTDHDAIPSVFAAAAEAHGPVDVLVNNAGITGRLGPFLDSDPARDRDILDVNVVALLDYCRHAARAWIDADRGGAIVNVSSVAARTGSAGEYVSYAASKAAVDAITLGLGRELAPHRIRVVGVAPGTTDTGIHAAAGDPDRAARVGARVPWGRAGAPDEVAEAVLWAASDAARYVTATTISVAGGL